MDMSIEKQINTLIKSLGESKALVNPDPNAGNLLVDPILPAAIYYWWEEYKRELRQEVPLVTRK